MATARERAATTRAQVESLRARGFTRRLPRRQRRLPRQVEPRGIEREYARALIALIARVERALQGLISELPELVRGAQAELRVDAGEGSRARAIIEAAEQGVVVGPSQLEVLAGRFAERVSTHNQGQLRRQIRAALGADLLATDTGVAALLDGFVAENVGLIKTIPSTVFREVETTVTRGLTAGTNTRDLTKQIRDRFAVSRNRARVIARDQIGKLNGQINARRQQNLGVTHFIWRTSQDERVRDDHQALEGRRFSFKAGSSEGLPGEPIQCRCYAEPDFSSIDKAVQPPPAPVRANRTTAKDRSVSAPPSLRTIRKAENADKDGVVVLWKASQAAKLLDNVKDITGETIRRSPQTDPARIVEAANFQQRNKTKAKRKNLTPARVSINEKGEMFVVNGRHRISAMEVTGVDVPIRFVEGI